MTEEPNQGGWDWVQDEFIAERQYDEWVDGSAPPKARYEQRECPTCGRNVQLPFWWSIADEKYHCSSPDCPHCETWLIPPTDE